MKLVSLRFSEVSFIRSQTQHDLTCVSCTHSEAISHGHKNAIFKADSAATFYMDVLNSALGRWLTHFLLTTETSLHEMMSNFWHFIWWSLLIMNSSYIVVKNLLESKRKYNWNSGKVGMYFWIWIKWNERLSDHEPIVYSQQNIDNIINV